MQLSLIAALSAFAAFTGALALPTVGRDIVARAAQAGAPAARPLHPNGDTTRCLDLEDGVYANGTKIIINDCDANSQSQLFQFVIGGETKIRTILDNGVDPLVGWCVDATEEPLDDGDRVHLWECNSYIQQKWAFTDDQHIAISGGDDCLDVPDGEKAADTQVQILTCSNTTENQIWTTSDA